MADRERDWRLPRRNRSRGSLPWGGHRRSECCAPPPPSRSTPWSRRRRSPQRHRRGAPIDDRSPAHQESRSWQSVVRRELRALHRRPFRRLSGRRNQSRLPPTHHAVPFALVSMQRSLGRSHQVDQRRRGLRAVPAQWSRRSDRARAALPSRVISQQWRWRRARE